MRYRFIQAEKAVYPVGVLCRVLDVARSGFYAWCQRPMSMRAQENQGLVTHIRACYQASRGRYGSPRIHQNLKAQGFRVGRHRVARLMRHLKQGTEHKSFKTTCSSTPRNSERHKS
jgi:hypothetical protein